MKRVLEAESQRRESELEGMWESELVVLGLEEYIFAAAAIVVVVDSD